MIIAFLIYFQFIVRYLTVKTLNFLYFIGVMLVLRFDFQKFTILKILNFHTCYCVFGPNILIPPWLAQLVARPTADPGVASLILAQSHTFVEIGHEIISMVILLLPQIQEGLLSVTSESMCTKY